MKTIREKFEELEESKLESTLKDYEFLVQSKFEENPNTSYEDISPVEFKFYKKTTFEHIRNTFAVSTYYAYDPFLDKYVGKFVAEGEGAIDVFPVLTPELEYTYSSVKYIYATTLNTLLEELSSVRKYLRKSIPKIIYSRRIRAETGKFHLKSQNIVKK